MRNGQKISDGLMRTRSGWVYDPLHPSLDGADINALKRDIAGALTRTSRYAGQVSYNNASHSLLVLICLGELADHQETEPTTSKDTP